MEFWGNSWFLPDFSTISSPIKSVNNGELRRFHVEATERALILDRTAIHLAVSDTMIPTGTGIIMTMDQTSGVVINEIV